MTKLLISIAVVLTLLRGHVMGATPGASASATVSPVAQANPIDNLKERLATKVAQLRQSQKKAITGVVKNVSVSTVTVETKTSDVKIELTDTIKVFQRIKDKRTALTTEDIEKGDSVVVFGDYDASLDLLKAKIIVIQELLPERSSGTITAIDTKNFTLTIVTNEKKEIVVDIEKTTAVTQYTPGTGIIKSGFSKLVIGNTVHVIGPAVAKSTNRISALRVLDIGNQSGVMTPTPTTEPTEESSPSATKKSTPSPSAKTTSTKTPTPKPTSTP